MLSRQPTAAWASSAAQRTATASGLKRTSNGLRTGLRPATASAIESWRIAECGGCCDGPCSCSRSRSVETGADASTASASSRGADVSCAATRHAASVHDIRLEEMGRINRPPNWKVVATHGDRRESYAGLQTDASPLSPSGTVLALECSTLHRCRSGRNPGLRFAGHSRVRLCCAALPAEGAEGPGQTWGDPAAAQHSALGRE
jgi:hypothetical protein